MPVSRALFAGALALLLGLTWTGWALGADEVQPAQPGQAPQAAQPDQPKDQPAPPADPEATLFAAVTAKASAAPPQGATRQEQLGLITKHLLEVQQLCTEYVQKFPEAAHVGTVKIIRMRTVLLGTVLTQDPVAGAEAAKEGEKLLADYGKTPEAGDLRAVLIQHYLANNKLEEATQHLKVLAADPGSPLAPQALILLAQIDFGQEKFADAVASLKQLSEKFPQTNEGITAQRMLPLASLAGQKLQMKFTSTAGKGISIEDYRGKVVLVSFWASRSQACQQDTPGLVKLHEERGKDGFDIIGVSLDTEKGEMEAYVKGSGMTWPEFFDPKGAESDLVRGYGVFALPTTLLVDRSGVVRSVNLRGEQLASRVDFLLKEKPEKAQ